MDFNQFQSTLRFHCFGTISQDICPNKNKKPRCCYYKPKLILINRFTWYKVLLSNNAFCFVQKNHLNNRNTKNTGLERLVKYSYGVKGIWIIIKRVLNSCGNCNEQFIHSSLFGPPFMPLLMWLRELTSKSILLLLMLSKPLVNFRSVFVCT